MSVTLFIFFTIVIVIVKFLPDQMFCACFLFYIAFNSVIFFMNNVLFILLYRKYLCESPMLWVLKESTPVLSFNIHNIGQGGQEFRVWTGLISEYIRRPNSTPGRRIFGAYWIFRRRVGAYSAPIEFLGDGSAHIRRRAVQISASSRRPTGRQNPAAVGPNGGADSVQFRQVLLLGKRWYHLIIYWQDSINFTIYTQYSNHFKYIHV